jgi:hypothetical protein
MGKRYTVPKDLYVVTNKLTNYNTKAYRPVVKQLDLTHETHLSVTNLNIFIRYWEILNAKYTVYGNTEELLNVKACGKYSYHCLIKSFIH